MNYKAEYNFICLRKEILRHPGALGKTVKSCVLRFVFPPGNINKKGNMTTKKTPKTTTHRKLTLIEARRLLQLLNPYAALVIMEAYPGWTNASDAAPEDAIPAGIQGVCNVMQEIDAREPEIKPALNPVIELGRIWVDYLSSLRAMICR